MDIGEIRIGTGRHAGAVVVLGEAPASVGTDPSCDVVLSDSGLAPLHFTLRATEEGTVVTAHGGALRIDDETEIGPGFRAVVRGPMTLGAGPVRMEVIPPPPAALRRGRAPRRAAMLPVLVCAGLLIGAQSTGTASTPGPRPAPVADRQPEPSARPAIASADAAPAARARAGSPAIAAAVAARLGELGLAGVAVSEAGGTVVLSGEVPPAARTDWAAFQRWFDARWPGAVMQAGAVALTAGDAAAPDFPAIQSVWSMGGAPYVVIGGTQVRIGNAIDGGWTLTAIDGASVTLRRGGRDWRLDLIDAGQGGAGQGGGTSAALAGPVPGAGPVSGAAR